MSKQQLKNQSQIPSEFQDYQPSEKEAHLVHALIEQEAWDKGKRLSKPVVQKFTIPAFANFQKNAAGLGYTVNVLHTPETAEEKSERIAEEEKETAKAAEKAAKAEKEAAEKAAKEAKKTE